MDERGYIKAYRKIEDDPVICKDNDYFRVWFYLLFHATHKEKKIIFKNKEITIPKGSLITGRKAISENCHISESKIDRILKRFEECSKIEQQMSNKNRLIIIKKWYLYQQSGQQVNNKWTTSEHKQECNNENNIYVCNNNARMRDVTCHLGSQYKNENCFYCMKKKICKNSTSSEFLLKHNGQDFNKWNSEREEQLNQMAMMKPQENLELELLDYDFLEDPENIMKK